MRNINTLSSKYYLFLTVSFGLLSMMLYRATLFRCIFFNSYNSSKIKLWILFVVCLTISYLLTFRHRRNYFSVFANSVFPFGLFALETLGASHPFLAFAVEAGVFVLCALFGFAMICNNHRPHDPTKLCESIKRGFVHFLNGIKSISSVGFFIFISYVLILTTFSLPSLTPAVKPLEKVNATKAEYLQENLSEIVKIHPTVWKTLSFMQRLDTLQTLANVEKVQSGITHEINLKSKNLGMATYGTYDFETHCVSINNMLIKDDDPTQAVSTLMHEIRHAYQHEVTDALLSLDKEYQQLALFDDARSFFENNADYKSIYKGDTFKEYESQPVESDSRLYSEERAAYYFALADECFAEAEKGG